MSGIQKFELSINACVPEPFDAMVYYDFDKDEPVDFKFIKFHRRPTYEADYLCAKGGHHKGKFSQERVRFYVCNIPEGVKPFTMHLHPCKKCHLPHKVMFTTYPKPMSEYDKVGDMTVLRSLDHSSKKLQSAKVHPVNEVTIEGS